MNVHLYRNLAALLVYIVFFGYFQSNSSLLDESPEVKFCVHSPTGLSHFFLDAGFAPRMVLPGALVNEKAYRSAVLELCGGFLPEFDVIACTPDGRETAASKSIYNAGSLSGFRELVQAVDVLGRCMDARGGEAAGEGVCGESQRNLAADVRLPWGAWSTRSIKSALHIQTRMRPLHVVSSSIGPLVAHVRGALEPLRLHRTNSVPSLVSVLKGERRKGRQLLPRRSFAASVALPHFALRVAPALDAEALNERADRATAADGAGTGAGTQAVAGDGDGGGADFGGFNGTFVAEVLYGGLADMDVEMQLPAELPTQDEELEEEGIELLRRAVRLILRIDRELQHCTEFGRLFGEDCTLNVTVRLRGSELTPELDALDVLRIRHGDWTVRGKHTALVDSVFRRALATVNAADEPRKAIVFFSAEEREVQLVDATLCQVHKLLWTLSDGAQDLVPPSHAHAIALRVARNASIVPFRTTTCLQEILPPMRFLFVEGQILIRLPLPFRGWGSRRTTPRRPVGAPLPGQLPLQQQRVQQPQRQHEEQQHQHAD